jgi:hypothetical protein
MNSDMCDLLSNTRIECYKSLKIQLPSPHKRWKLLLLDDINGNVHKTVQIIYNQKRSKWNLRNYLYLILEEDIILL